MPRFFIVRHGKTRWNDEGRYQGKMDIPLSEEGMDQARKVGNALKGFPVSAVYSSPLSRCLQTAREIARHHMLEVRIEEDLREIDHGEWEGMLSAEVEKKYPELLKMWKESPGNVKMPNGESLKDVYERVVRVFEKIARSHGSEEILVIVGHDATNKVLMCYLLGVDLNMFWTFKQANCGITVVEYDPFKKNVIIHTANATGHLGKEIDFEVQKAL